MLGKCVCAGLCICAAAVTGLAISNIYMQGFKNKTLITEDVVSITDSAV